MIEQSYNWIVSCINSSTNKFQFDCCRKLIEYFEAMYKDSNEMSFYSGGELRDLLNLQELKFNIEI